MTVLSQDKLESALEWLARGVALVPLRERSKHVVKGWGANQKTITNEATARQWFAAGLRANMGAVLGPVLCLDFESKDAYTTWRNGPGAEVQTIIEQAARGYHVFFTRAPGAMWRNVSALGVELKVSGVVMVAPSARPSGVLYRQLTNFELPHLQLELLPDSILNNLAHVTTPPARARPLPALGKKSLVEQIKAVLPVLPLAQQLIERLTGDGRYRHGRCPFHDDQQASFWCDVEKNLWGCFAASCPQHGSHDVITLYSVIHHIDAKQAIKSLAAEVLA